jgi:putative intracellular protease/amidase/nitroreductase
MKFILVGIVCIAFEAALYGADANSAAAATPATPSAPAQRPLRSEPNFVGTMTVEEAIAQQTSTQKFSSLPLDNSQLLQLSRAAQSTIAASKNDKPIELYFCLAGGVYHYNQTTNTVESLGTVDVRSILAIAAQNETALQQAPCAIVIAGSVGTAPTGPRTQVHDRMVLAAGRIAQTMTLEAASLGLGTMGVGSFDIGKVKRVTKLSVQQEPLYIIAVGYPAEAPLGRAARNAQKHALLIIDGGDRSDELFNVMDVLTTAKIQLTIAQRGKTTVRIDKYQRTIEPDMRPQDVVVADYDAIIVVGTSGNLSFMRDPAILNVIRAAVRAGKIVGALGDAAQSLVNAGVLNGVRVTGDRRLIMRSGGIYTDQLVESDQGIVTSMANQQSGLFARAVVDAIKGVAPQPASSAAPRQRTY